LAAAKTGWAACTLVIAASFLCGVAIPRAQPATRANITHGCVDRFDAAVDYFPDKTTVEDAGDFRIEYRKSYKVVTVRDVSVDGAADRYVLVQCGAPRPALVGDLAGAQIVTVPITSLYASSTTHLPLLVELRRLDVLAGVSRRIDLTGDEVARHAALHPIHAFAERGTIDAEAIVAGRPSLLMTTGAFSASISAIRAAGVPVAADIEWREPTALARAEWIKFMALFLNEERQADAVYRATKARYQTIRARSASIPASSKPLVMTGRSTRGTFIIAGGRSYVASLIADAGGRYAWADESSAGVPSVDFEAQVHRAADADIWINGGGWPSRAAMLADEPRYAVFKAFQRGQVWVYERRMTPDGVNDYWSRSVSHPDLLLADLVKIFHPSLMADHAFEWYLPVPER